MHSLYMGMVTHPYNGYINPYYWVDEFIPYYMEVMGVLLYALRAFFTIDMFQN